MKNYEHISDAERRSIERGLRAGLSRRAVALRLHRSPNTVADEIARNSAGGVYDARKAARKAEQRRKRSKIQCLKVALDKNLKNYVARHIGEEQSPQGISRRLKHVERGLPYASTKAIYKFVRSVHGRQVERCLYSKRVKKKGGPKRRSVRAGESGKKRVGERPTRANRREEFGHYEGDFIESGKDGRGSLLVLVERKTRYPFLVYTERRDTAHINALVVATLAGCPVRSVTLDNDLSFQKHETLSRLLDASIFFTHPYTSQEKGGVENRNRAVRQHLPKRTDFSGVPAEEIRRVEAWLRTRFMVVLDGRTPAETWEEETARERAKGQRRASRGATKKFARGVVV